MSGKFACISFESLSKFAVEFDEFEIGALYDTDTVVSMFEEGAIALLAPDEPPLLAVNQHQQNTDNDHVDGHRDKEMLGSLLDFPARLGVFGAGKGAIDPGIERRT